VLPKGLPNATSVSPSMSVSLSRGTEPWKISSLGALTPSAIGASRASSGLRAPCDSSVLGRPLLTVV